MARTSRLSGWSDSRLWSNLPRPPGDQETVNGLGGERPNSIARFHGNPARHEEGKEAVEQAPHDHHLALDIVSGPAGRRDRKSTRLNSSHGYISYAVFCLKKKKHIQKTQS